MIDQQDPDANCDCSKFNDPILRAGCENFFSLQWNNAPVTYEEVSCPFELDRLNCWEENGEGYPFDIPQFCASNIDDDHSTPTSSPTKQPTPAVTTEPTVSNPGPCTENPSDKFFLKMKPTDPTKPVYKDCAWLAASIEKKIKNICTKKTNSYGGIGPAKDVCKVTCDTCDETSAPVTSPVSRPPTLAPTSSPSTSPVTSPTGSGPCCSQDFRTCTYSSGEWCEANCSSCGGVMITGAPLQCIARYGECTNNVSGCCEPATCQGSSSYRQCLK